MFTLTGYVDSSGKEISIIKDWKDLVNQVLPITLCRIYLKKVLYIIVN